MILRRFWHRLISITIYRIITNDDGTFTIDHQPNNNLKQIHITPDLSFANNLTLDLDNGTLASLILAVVIRLERTYKKAFTVHCNYYPIVEHAKRILSNSLGIKVHHNSLCRFMTYPVPGKRPIKEKPLSTQEISARYTKRRRERGEVQLKCWLPKTLREELTQYTQMRGCTLEAALVELLPLGINIGTYLTNQSSTTENNAI